MKLSLLTVALRALPVLTLASLAHGQVILPGFLMCEPVAGTGGVPCPCGGVLPFHGCDNSAGPGAVLYMNGGASSLSADALVLIADGVVPGSLAILLQGDTELSTGVVFGQGVLCAGGNLKRMYSAFASATGTVRMPPAGQPSLSARASDLGDTIAAGEMRYYQVVYRDTVVPGGCPATSTFNTSTGAPILWGM